MRIYDSSIKNEDGTFGNIREMTQQEVEDIQNTPQPAEPTKEELHAQLQAIQEQINNLGV